MGKELDLLRSLPKSQRDVAERAAQKDPEVVRIAREFGHAYFDGDRKYGYGGYIYDGRWRSVAEDIVDHYGDFWWAPVVLDVGCAKGFLVQDFQALFDRSVLGGGQAFGIDVSRYAICDKPWPDVVGRLHLGCAACLPFPDNSFDLVVSINTLHNLNRPDICAALREIMRVSRDPAYVVVDAYRTEEQRRAAEDWIVTARWWGSVDEWLELFAEAGYEGDYGWTIVEAG